MTTHVAASLWHALKYFCMRVIHQRQLLVAGATVTVAAASVVYAAATVWGQKGSKTHKFREPKRILITGAAGQIAYALAPLLASGQMLGPEQPVVLQLYDVPAAADLLQGLQAELEDAMATYPLLQGVSGTTDFTAACQDVSVAILCGGVSRRGSALSKVQLMAANCAIYRDQAAGLAAFAAPGVKVVVVASPANTNAWVLQQFAPSIPAQDITALTRLDHNRALQHLAGVLGAHASEVTNVIVWGNHASSQFPYGHLAKFRGQPILQQQQQQLPVRRQQWQQQGLDVADLEDYLRNEFITIVQSRGLNISRLRVQLSPALSAAAAICAHVHDWLLGTPPGDFVSMGVSSDGSYGIAHGLVYSFPVQCSEGSWTITRGLPIQAWAWARMKISEADLLEEQALALQVLAAAASSSSSSSSSSSTAAAEAAAGGNTITKAISRIRDVTTAGAVVSSAPAAAAAEAVQPALLGPAAAAAASTATHATTADAPEAIEAAADAVHTATSAAGSEHAAALHISDELGTENAEHGPTAPEEAGLVGFSATPQEHETGIGSAEPGE